MRKNSTVTVPPPQEMTKDGLIENALREENIFPPSVMDRHYGDKVEMTKAEIIVRSLEEMGMLPLSEQDAKCGSKIRHIHIVVADLQRRLPGGNIVTCGAFRVLNTGCCDSCHTDPVRGMTLLDLPYGGKAWICCALEAASSPEPYGIFHEPNPNSPAAKMLTGKFGKGDRREN